MLYLCALQEEFDKDRELRLQREAELMKQLTDHEYVVTDHFEKQIVRQFFVSNYFVTSVSDLFIMYYVNGSNLESTSMQRYERFWRRIFAFGIR